MRSRKVSSLPACAGLVALRLLWAFGISAIGFSSPLVAAPVVTAVVNGATFASGALAPGTLISIFGTGLASSPASASLYPLPASLGGTTVSIGSVMIPLFYASATQINAQLPYSVSNGAVTLTVRDSSRRTGSFSITVMPVSPGIFTSVEGSGQAAALHADFTPVVRAVGGNAKTGETISLFCTGLGALNGFSTAGTAAPSLPAADTSIPVAVSMNGVFAQVVFAGLAPGYASVYQVNFVIPPGVGGDVATAVQIGGVTSASAIVSVNGAYTLAQDYLGGMQVRATGRQSQIAFDSVSPVSTSEFTAVYRVFSGSTVLESGSMDVQSTATGFLIWGAKDSGEKFIGVMNSLDAAHSFFGWLYAGDSADVAVQNPDNWYESFTVSAAALSPHSVFLTWTPSTSQDVAAYNIYRTADPNTSSAWIGSSSDAAWADLTAAAGGVYWYQVTAINSAGESIPSNQASAAIPNP